MTQTKPNPLSTPTQQLTHYLIHTHLNTIGPSLKGGKSFLLSVHPLVDRHLLSLIFSHCFLESLQLSLFFFVVIVLNK